MPLYLIGIKSREKQPQNTQVIIMWSLCLPLSLPCPGTFSRICHLLSQWSAGTAGTPRAGRGSRCSAQSAAPPSRWSRCTGGNYSWRYASWSQLPGAEQIKKQPHELSRSALRLREARDSRVEEGSLVSESRFQFWGDFSTCHYEYKQS